MALYSIVIVFNPLCFTGSTKLQDKEAGGPVGVPPLPVISKKPGVQVKSTTSGSSGEQSDDDEAEGENEATQNRDPADAKRMRRYLPEYFSCQWFCSMDSFAILFKCELKKLLQM